MDGNAHDPQAGTRFPTTKLMEGYDVAAVDEHLARLVTDLTAIQAGRS